MLFTEAIILFVIDNLSLHEQQRGARNPRQRGGHRGGRQFSNEEFGRENQSGGTPDKDQKWREERQQIDEARVKRGTNSEGNWRREWDNEKSDSQQQPQHQQSRCTIVGKTKRRGIDFWDGISVIVVGEEEEKAAVEVVDTEAKILEEMVQNSSTKGVNYAQPPSLKLSS